MMFGGEWRGLNTGSQRESIYSQLNGRLLYMIDDSVCDVY